MSDYDFDLGSFEDLAAVDAGNLADMDFGNFDVGNLADIGNIGDIDLGGLEGLDFSDFQGMDLDAIINSMGNQGIEGLENIDLGDARVLAELGGGPLPLSEPEGFENPNRPNLENPNFDIKEETKKQYEEWLKNNPSQAEGEKHQKLVNEMEFRPGDEGIVPSKMTSQWQKTKDGRYIMINDDGTGIGIDEDGNSFALSQSQVQDRIRSGDLNTYASGYYTATGGNRIAPGGGLSIGDGKYLTTDGKVVYTDKNGNLTTKPPGGGTKNPFGGSGGGGGSEDSGLGALLPFLLMMLMMNQNKGGGGSSATIPGLTATQRQTPYAQQQRAPGYRPGQGGITYFDQTQYAPKMAAGGGISRLLRGPGDGVSDSIPAVISSGMAKGGQPARLARGEYVIDARTVAALGNGSTDAGAERLDKMRKNILRDDRKAGVGKDSKAYRHLMA